MKKAFIFLITLYQSLLSPLLHHFGIGGCRYSVSCSEYAKRAIAKEGFLKGSFLALKRLSTCHPFGKIAMDRV